jgi:hypothetical protein
MLDYNFWLPLAGTLGTIYAAYWQRKAVIMAIEAQHATAITASNVPSIAWWKSPPFIALFLLSVSLWGPYILSQLSAPTRLQGVGMAISGDADMFSHFLNATKALSLCIR